MKTGWALSIGLIAIFLKTSICLSMGVKVYPTPNGLRNAINNAHNGDTLLLQNGIYKEHDLVIQKKIVVTGNLNCIIDCENKFQAFIIQSDFAVINGIEIRNIGRSSITDMAGIRVVNANFVTISNNRFTNNTYGIYLQNASQCSMLNNTISSDLKDEVNGGNGIHAWKSDHLLVKGNSVSGHRDGIYFEFVTESHIVSNNSFNNARYGLHFMFSHNDTYSLNTFKDNGAGVAVMYSRGVIMQGNNFLHNWGDASYGLLLKEITDSKIDHNQFIKNTVGIHMEGTTRVDVKQNLFQDNGWALRVQASCSGSNFIGNNFISNSFDIATNGTLMLNVFDRNFWDKYDGYDLNRNSIGDVPYYPVSVYSVISEKIPSAMILYHSFLTDIIEKVEKVMPTMIPDKLKDDNPIMKKLKL